MKIIRMCHVPFLVAWRPLKNVDHEIGCQLNKIRNLTKGVQLLNAQQVLNLQNISICTRLLLLSFQKKRCLIVTKRKSLDSICHQLQLQN